MTVKRETSCLPVVTESGVTLVTIALSLVVLVGLLGFAIDSFFATTSKTQYQASADAAALGAVEEYLAQRDLAPLASPATLAGHARDAAQRLLQLNTNNLVSRKLMSGFVNPTLTLNPGGVGTGDSGTVTAGYWFTADPDSADFRPPNWDAECAGGAPCFVPLQSLSVPPGEPEPNAFKVTLATNPANGIRTMFMKVLGAEQYGVTASAIATTIPRRAAFMLDLSSSIHSDTHSLTHPTKSPTMYAYPLTGACAFGDTVTASDILNVPTLGAYNPHPIFAALPSVPVNGNFDQMDFRCVPVDFNLDNSIDEYYAVDTQEFDPQPLTSILEGIQVAMKTFQGNAVPGDKIGIFGFDEGVNIEDAADVQTHQSRYTRFGRGSASEKPGLVVLDSPEFIRFLEATSNPSKDLKGSNTLTLTHLTAGLFPRMFGGIPSGSPPIPGQPTLPTQTIISRAAKDVASALTREPDLKQSDNFVVLFTDGISTCEDDGSNNLNCSTTYPPLVVYATYQGKAAFDEDPNSLFVENNVALHTVLVGETSTPHTLVRAGPPPIGGGGYASRCLKDLEARALSPTGYNSFDNDSRKFANFWEWPDPANPSNTLYYETLGSQMPSKFAYPNLFYEATRSLGGYWAPLREPCSTTNPPANTQADLDAACATKAPFSMDVSFAVPGLGPDKLDQEGRLLCDPTNVSKETQIETLINNIMDANPFILVGN